MRPLRGLQETRVATREESGQGLGLVNRGPEMLLTFEPLLKIWGKMTEKPLPYQGSLPAELCDPREVWGSL